MSVIECKADNTRLAHVMIHLRPRPGPARQAMWRPSSILRNALRTVWLSLRSRNQTTAVVSNGSDLKAHICHRYLLRVKFAHVVPGFGAA